MTVRFDQHATRTFSVFVVRRAVAPPLARGATIDLVFLSSSVLCGSTRLDIVDSPARRQSAAAAVLEPKSS